MQSKEILKSTTIIGLTLLLTHIITMIFYPRPTCRLVSTHRSGTSSFCDLESSLMIHFISEADTFVVFLGYMSIVLGLINLIQGINNDSKTKENIVKIAFPFIVAITSFAISVTFIHPTTGSDPQPSDDYDFVLRIIQPFTRDHNADTSFVGLISITTTLMFTYMKKKNTFLLEKIKNEKLKLFLLFMLIWISSMIIFSIPYYYYSATTFTGGIGME